MTKAIEPLILDLLEWIGSDTRTYDEVIDAWKTSCPRLPIWEEANARGFLTHQHAESVGKVVSVSERGANFLAEQRP